MSVEEETEPPAPNCFRILIATDNHLGYLEKDPIRGNDSFQAFAEILTLARDRKVDFVLLGGDLFHDNKPSRKTLHKTMTLLRQFCMGSNPVAFSFVSAQDETFKTAFATVNYMDPNYNVSIPIFSIHGNHDDPSGDGDLCALDLLSAAGLVNYFGRAEKVDDVQIRPMLLKKDGGVKVAVYGMGNIRDERLYRTFVGKKVRMFRPKEDTDEWFNIFVIHQNRVKRGPTNYIPETFLPDFLHLILWGHEHDCHIDLEQNDEKGFYITQPGSSVATSLSEGETIAKHVGILEIFPDKEFKLDKVALKTVRPFVMGDIVLADIKLKARQKMDEKRISDVLCDKVDEMIEEAKQQWLAADDEREEEDFPKPLIRLRVDYSNFTTLNPQRFGQRFVDKVANVKDILHFHRKRQVNTDKKSKDVGFDVPITLPDKLDKFQVQDLVQEFLKAQNLEILPENGIGEAVRLFVEKEDKEAISDFYTDSLKRTQQSLSKSTLDIIFDEENLMKQITKEKQEAAVEIDEDIVRSLNTGKSSRKKKQEEEEDEEANSDASMADPEPAPRKRGAAASKPAAKKRASTAATTTAKRSTAGVKRKKPVESEEEEEAVVASENEEEAVQNTPMVISDEDDDVVMNSPAAPPKTTRNAPVASSSSNSRASVASSDKPPVAPSRSSRASANSQATSSKPKTGSALRQTTLNFGSQSQSQASPIPKSDNASSSSSRIDPKPAVASVATKTPAAAKSSTSRATASSSSAKGVVSSRALAASKRSGPTAFVDDSDDDDDGGFADFGAKGRR
ncbi:Double-strand break repair protein mre11a [Rhizoclosmatium sp. JEL0117]|nr:Double-strand break repair protein mre11a [Rhizoclosmatium sp. JEL0117]